MSIKYNDCFLDSGKFIGISIGHQSSQDNLHNKILINYDDNIVEMHLAFHHRFLCTDIINSRSYIWETPKLHPLKLKIVAAKCLSIIDIQNKNTNLLPYAFGYQAKRNFSNEGIYSNQTQGDEYGMSCATFILTVFNSVGIDLLDWKKWVDREEDRVVFGKLLLLLKLGVRNGEVSNVHYENIKSEINVPKIRPEEVFSSVYSKRFPMDFSCSDYFGSFIRNICVNLPLQR